MPRSGHGTPAQRDFALKITGAAFKRVHVALLAERETFEDPEDKAVADLMLDRLWEIRRDHDAERRAVEIERRALHEQKVAAEKAQAALRQPLSMAGPTTSGPGPSALRPGRDLPYVDRAQQVLETRRAQFRIEGLDLALRAIVQERAVLMAQDNKPLAEVNGINRAIDAISRLMGLSAENYKEPDYAE